MLAPIVTGFSTPLEEFHTIFFVRVIVQLYAMGYCDRFYKKLSRCSEIFVSKAPSLGYILIKKLLKNWLYVNFHVEIYYLKELSKMLYMTECERFSNSTLTKLCYRVMTSIDSKNNKVSSKATSLFQNRNFLR